MEVDAVKEMFSTFESKYGVRTAIILAMVKTFKAILDLKPYGDDFQVKKCECIGHVQKRMSSRLRSVKKEKNLEVKEN